MNTNQSFKWKEVQKMWNLDNFYIWGPRFVMSRTDAQNRVDIIFKSHIKIHICARISLPLQITTCIFKWQHDNTVYQIAKNHQACLYHLSYTKCLCLPFMFQLLLHINSQTFSCIRNLLIGMHLFGQDTWNDTIINFNFLSNFKLLPK